MAEYAAYDTSAVGRRDHEATQLLKEGARKRAVAEGLRCFSVVFAGNARASRMPVRGAPSRDAEVVGSRATGDDVLAEEVSAEGWV